MSLNPGEPMRLHLPGLMRETLPSGNVRWRVRPAGNKRRKIPITVSPGDPDFNRRGHGKIIANGVVKGLAL